MQKQHIQEGKQKINTQSYNSVGLKLDSQSRIKNKPVVQGPPYFNQWLQGQLSENRLLQGDQLESKEDKQEYEQKYFKELFGSSEQIHSVQFMEKNETNIKSKQQNLSKVDSFKEIFIKEETLYEKFKEIKIKNLQKYQTILSILQFLFKVKAQIKLIRFDPYSAKIFAAFKNSCIDDLNLFLFTIKKMHKQIFKNIKLQNCSKKFLRKQTNQTFSTSNSLSQRCKENQFQLKNKQFLLLIRFLTSQQKILQFIKNQQIQQYYIFLIENMCLGHYNNQANKKTPEKHQIELLKELLKVKNGKQIFQKICAINHGNKLRRYNMNAYQLLYKMNLATVSQIHLKVKKRESLQQITKIIEQKEKWTHFSNNSINNISEVQNQHQKEDSSEQFLNNHQKERKNVSVRHVGSLRLSQDPTDLSIKIKKMSSVQIEDITKKIGQKQQTKQANK